VRCNLTRGTKDAAANCVANDDGYPKAYPKDSKQMSSKACGRTRRIRDVFGHDRKSAQVEESAILAGRAWYVNPK
jgi:hypothetical protein